MLAIKSIVRTKEKLSNKIIDNICLHEQLYAMAQVSVMSSVVYIELQQCL